MFTIVFWKSMIITTTPDGLLGLWLIGFLLGWIDVQKSDCRRFACGNHSVPQSPPHQWESPLYTPAHVTHEDFDLLIEGGTVITGDPERPLIRSAWMGVKDGRITWLDRDPPPARRAGRQLSLRDHFITPGFVNVHSHAILTMVRGVAADLGFAPSYTPGIPKGTQVNPDQARALARLGALEALSFGSTLLGDNFVHADVCADAMCELGLRLAPSWRIHDVDFSTVARGEWRHEPGIGERTLRAGLALHQRWRDHPKVTVNLAAHAVDTCSEGFLREIGEQARRLNLVVSTHLGQSMVEVERVRARTGRSSTEVLEDCGLLNARLLGGHCIYLSDSDLDRMAASGAHAVHIPKPNATSGRLAPTPRIKARGINIALATDTQHGDMIELMRWALITARVQEGGVSADWQPHHVFDMATMGGARALGLADRIGSLRVGKQADFVAIDASRPHLVPHVDPLGNLVHTGQGRDVSHVAVDGELLIEHGEPTRVDRHRIVAEAEQAARALWGSEGKSYWLQ
jgi:5-methylthioadenosine/S-adenosylhomocysteine deaminase